MHVIFRTLLVLLKARRRSKVSPWETAVLPLRALPTDIDLLGHINNGQYFSLFDLGRFDHLSRSGVLDKANKRGWHAVVQAEQITFRKSVRLWNKFEIHSRLLGFDDRCVFFEQRAVIDGEIYVRATIAGRLVGKNGPVPNEELIAMLHELPYEVPENLEVSEELKRWRAESALPASRRPAPNVWVS